MFPPKKSDEETAIQGLLESLSRAGLEVTDVLRDPASNAWVIRLYSMPPKNGVAPMSSYIKYYAKACGFFAKVRLTKCRLWVSMETATTTKATHRS
jgi:hypothetical protein